MAVAIAASACIVVQQLGAATPAAAPNVTFSASGTFATTPISGAEHIQAGGRTI